MRRTLGMMVAVVVLVGCATGAPIAGVGGSATSSDESSTLSAGVTAAVPTSSAGAPAPCDLEASGAAGVPTADSKPLFVFRASSYWDPHRSFGPVAVVYQDGSVAINHASEKVTKRPTDPLRPMLGGRFAPCALAELTAEFEAIAASDLGEPWIYDATELVVSRIGPKMPAGPGSFTLVGYRSGPFPNLTPEQQKARARADAWVSRMQEVTAGVTLPVTALAVADAERSPGSPTQRPARASWAASVPAGAGCATLTGRDVGTALASVRAAFRSDRSYQYWNTVFTGWFRSAGAVRLLAVMVLPPGMSC